MEEKEPYFDLTKATQIGKCVAHYIDALLRKDNTGTEAKVLKKLKEIFDPNSANYLKVVKGKRFTSTFFQKIGVRRAPTLKYLLCKIDNKYKEFDYKLN
jgi:hypothetical protein